MENQEVVLKEFIETVYSGLNQHEIPDELKENLEKRINEVKNQERFRYHKSVLLDLNEMKKDFKNKNFRFLLFDPVDRFEKYTTFYNEVREIYERKFPERGDDFINNPWQILDFAIIQFERDLNATRRGEIDLFWIDKFINRYSPSDSYFYDRVDDFIELLNIINKMDDCYLVEEITNHHFKGMSCNSPETEEEFYVMRKSVPSVKVPLDKAYDNVKEKLANQIDAHLKELREIIRIEYKDEKSFHAFEVTSI